MEMNPNITTTPDYVLLLGASGRLGQECTALMQDAGISLQTPSHLETTIENLAGLLAARPPAMIVNAAAFTDVDAAESHRTAAARINADLPAVLAKMANMLGIRLIHISTDFVFSGQVDSPYREDDETGPINWYGTTKRDGERAVMMMDHRAIILRTAWLHGNRRPCFIQAIAQRLGNGEMVEAIADRYGSPTSAAALAGQIVTLCQRVLAGDDIPSGIFHASGVGAASPFDIALEIAGLMGVDRNLVVPVSASDRQERALRPDFCALDCQKMTDFLGLHCQPWQAGVAHTVLQSNINVRRVA
ncbi:MAG: sugar nucleotide-binding protein [Pseudomonadota bacterium]